MSIRLHLRAKNSRGCPANRASLSPIVLVLAGSMALAPPAPLRAADHGSAPESRIMTVQRDGYTISGLAAHLPEVSRFRHGIALFPGHPGILRLRLEEGRPRHAMAGNFIVRSQRHWLDAETLALLVDAPSDEWQGFRQAFRETPRYGEDIAALLAEVGRAFHVEAWTLVGTSEGTVSAFHAARMNPALARRLILTASLFQGNRNGRGLSAAEFAALGIPLLWVHHADDPCRVTSYQDARTFSRLTKTPLLTVRGGGPGHGPACEARSAHGFAGMEAQTVHAMRTWVKTGALPPDVGP